MRILCTLLAFLVVSSCSVRPVKTKHLKNLPEDEMIRTLMKRKSPRTGTYSTVTDGDVTTERFARKSSETILTLEKGELRTETENQKSGTVITRTYQDGVMTTFMLKTPTRTILVLLDKHGDFVHKFITGTEDEDFDCYRYDGDAVFPLTDTECAGLLPGFE
jgi:hypothetical protein